MQKITFETENGTIILSDSDNGSVNGKWCRLWLNDFDGNSLSLDVNSVNCLDIPGQKTISTTPAARTITLKIGFMPLYRENGALICTGEIGKHELRREVLKLFPPGVSGRLTYANDSGKWHITAWVSEAPKVSYTTRLWAEASVYFTVDYPFWELPEIESEAVTVSAGGKALITAPSSGDIASPLEIFVQVLQSAVGNGDAVFRCAACPDGKNPDVFQSVRCMRDIPAGTLLRYDAGINGVTMCSKKEGGYWYPAPEYIYFVEYEGELRNGITPTTFEVAMPFASSGQIKAHLVFHNLVTAI